jgi:hypothetical protein
VRDYVYHGNFFSSDVVFLVRRDVFDRNESWRGIAHDYTVPVGFDALLLGELKS